MRRSASSPRLGRPVCIRLVTGLVAVFVLAQGAASAQYMALTAPPKPEATRIAPSPEVRKPVPAQSPLAEHASDGRLPNQRTAPSRLRTVRDICIGCDR